MFCVNVEQAFGQQGLFFAQLMINFKNFFSIKIISLTVVVTFLVTNLAYGAELSERTCLRAPLLANSNEGVNRLKHALDVASAQRGRPADQKLVSISAVNLQIDGETFRLEKGQKGQALLYRVVGGEPVLMTRDKLLSFLDLDGDGSITLAEFITALSGITGLELTQVTLYMAAVFDIADTDDNWVLDYNEAYAMSPEIAGEIVNILWGELHLPTGSGAEVVELPSGLIEDSYQYRVETFIHKSNVKMAEMYGEKAVDDLGAPSVNSPELAAKLILAYISRDLNDKEWYKKAADITTGEGRLIVYTCHTGFIAHVGRALMVAEELRKLGAKVVFAADTNTMPVSGKVPTQRKYAQLIQEAGFEIVSMQTIDESRVMKYAQGSASWGFYTTEMIKKEAGAQIRTLDTIARREGKTPDIIVTDFSPVMRIAAEAKNIPVVSMLNFTWTNYSKRRLTPPEAHFITRLFNMVKLGRLAELLSEKFAVATILYKIYLVLWGIPYNIIRFQMGLRLVGNYYAQMQGDLVLMPDYAALKGMKTSSSALPIGPLEWEPTRGAALDTLTHARRLGETTAFEKFEEFIERDSDQPLIYLTMGSSGTQELFQMVIEALKDKPYRVAITTGAQFNLGELPDNFCAIPLYPGGLICKRAVLMINHGGSGSAYQAIKYALPSLMLPTHADQQWNGDAISKEENLGLMILRRNVTPEKIAEAVEILVAKSVRTHSKTAAKPIVFHISAQRNPVDGAQEIRPIAEILLEKHTPRVLDTQL